MKQVENHVDFEQTNRPRTRFKQFFDIFKHRFVELLKISFLQTVFNMPLIATLVCFYIFVRGATSINSLMTIYIITGVLIMFSMMSAFTGLTGSFYCMKQLIYAEGEFASSSFFLGLRSEWKRGLLTGFIVGFSAMVTIIGSFFFYFYLSNFDTTISGFGIVILVIQSILVYMVGYYAIGQTLIYENKYRHILKNGFLMTLMRFHINLGIFVLHPGIFIALVNIMDITMYVAIVLLVFLVAIGNLMWMLNCIGAFDKFINKENYPDYYKKGLYKEV